MSFVLPSIPEPDSALPRIISLRNELRSAIGGSLQRLGRKGGKYAFDFVMPRMGYADSLAFMGLRSLVGLVVMPITQGDLDVGVPGTSIRVNGGSQLGANLIVDGVTPFYPMRAGQFLTHIPASGPRRVYCCMTAATASSTGQLSIPLETMLGWPPADNDVVQIAEPTIEGFPVFDPSTWTADFASEVGLAFSVEEPG